MNNELFEIDEGPQKAVIEGTIKRARPSVLDLCWSSEENTETHIVTIKGPGERIRLKISQDALKATDDPANIPRLEREVQKQLRVSELGRAVGYVKEPEWSRANVIVDHGEQPLDFPGAAPNGGVVAWLFGRGPSIECELKWIEPAEWNAQYSRMERIERIRGRLPVEMDSPGVDPVLIREFLMLLDQHTAPEWRHLFVTTDWDYLLERELRAIVDGLRLPRWLHHGAGSWVHHVNGTVEEGTQHRSCFMLEDDSGTERTETTEANYAFNYLVWERTFVVLGMSFKCDTDKYLLEQLSKVENWMPIGEGHWIVVNPCGKDLETVCKLIREAFPAAQVEPVRSTFKDWSDMGFPGLKAKGVFRD